MNARVTTALWIAIAIACTACAARGPASPDKSIPAEPVAVSLAAAREHATRGEWTAAQATFSSLLRSDIRNGYLQFLHGLSYDQLSRQDPSQTDFAAVAYDGANRLAPGNYWAQLFQGYLDLRRGNHREAMRHFAEASQDEESGWEALYGLASAAYFDGDLAIAELATRRALLLAPERREVQRLSALVRARQGEAAPAREASQRYASLSPGEADARQLDRRVEHLLEIAQAETGAEPTPEPVPEPIEAPPQVVVDVTIILSSVLKNERRGVNLLDALRLQYGYSDATSRTRVESSSADPATTVTRTIMQQISIPQLNYNLNLFNDSGQYYNVLARPSLAAFLGRESTFFAGRTVNVQVSGVNLGQLQPIDVGISLKVLPEVIEPGRTTVTVHAERSFLSQEEIGRFDQSLTTFKQAVGATAQIAFGQTLILSTLSESVRDSSVSKVPILGDIPILSSVTSERNAITREETLLVLVTPQRPVQVEGLMAAPRPAEVQRLLRYWKEVGGPHSDLDDVLRRLEAMHLFTRAEPSDLVVRLPDEPRLVLRALDEVSSRIAS